MSWLKNIRNQNGKGASQALETTVTYLRMESPPSSAPPRPVNINAALLVTEKPPLHFYRYLYFHVGIHWHWEARLRLNDAALQKAIHAETCQITTLYVDGAPSGYFEINTAKQSPVDIAYFGMMPHVHGMGLGKWFLGQAIAAAWASEPDEVTVNTCTLDHPAALPLYQKMGFMPYKQATGRIYPLTQNERAALAMNHGIAAQ